MAPGPGLGIQTHSEQTSEVANGKETIARARFPFLREVSEGSFSTGSGAGVDPSAVDAYLGDSVACAGGLGAIRFLRFRLTASNFF